MADLKLKGKKALITGGGRGIGRATAMALADEGVHVAINYVSNDRPRRPPRRQSAPKGVKAVALKADVADPWRLRSWSRTQPRNWRLGHPGSRGRDRQHHAAHA